MAPKALLTVMWLQEQPRYLSAFAMLLLVRAVLQAQCHQQAQAHHLASLPVLCLATAQHLRVHFDRRLASLPAR
jgi:hypothetical protein